LKAIWVASISTLVTNPSRQTWEAPTSPTRCDISLAFAGPGLKSPSAAGESCGSPISGSAPFNPALSPNLPIPDPRCEAPAHGVFGDGARDHEMQQIVGAAGFGTLAGKL